MVAAAESNGDLVSFVNWFCTRRSHGAPSLMKMAVHGMPPGAGRKDGKTARKKSKPKQVPSEENRVPLNIVSCSPKPHHTDTTTATETRPQNVCQSSTDPAFQQLPPSTYLSFQQSHHHQPMDHSLYPWLCSPIHHLQQPPPSPYQSTPLPYGPYPTYQPPYPSHQLPSTPYQPPSSPYPSLYPTNQTIMSTYHGTPQQRDGDSDCFKFCFKTGNISVCNGCRKSFVRSDETVIQHAEFRHYTNPQTGLPASKFGNAYYHARRSCIQLKWGPAFDVNKLVVPEAITEKLTISQKQQLHQEFALVL